jgi:hypothetical protein
MKRLAAFVIIPGLGLGLLSGCASSASGGWTKPGMTQEQLGRDTADCLTDASRMVSGPEGPRRVVDQPRYRSCMAGRGYTVAPAN